MPPLKAILQVLVSQHGRPPVRKHDGQGDDEDQDSSEGEQREDAAPVQTNVPAAVVPVAAGKGLALALEQGRAEGVGGRRRGAGVDAPGLEQ